MCCCCCFGWPCCKSKVIRPIASADVKRLVKPKNGSTTILSQLTNSGNDYLPLPLFERRDSDDDVFVAQHSFKPATKDDLEINAGDQLKVTIEYDKYSWCRAINLSTNKEGLVLKEYLRNKKQLDSELWYFSNITLLEAENILLNNATEVGSYLVGIDRGSYFLSIRAATAKGALTFKHYQIKSTDDESFYISKDVECSTLQSLIQMYTDDVDNDLNLYCKLGKPCPKEEPRIFELSGQFRSNWEMNRNDVHFEKEIGGGNFSKVYIGKWNNKSIAIKEIEQNQVAQKDYKKEVMVMKTLKHRNIIGIYGTCSEKLPYLLIMEHIPLGSLENYLLENHMEQYDQISIAAQIANGMKYLEEKNVIHRDLAARNILLDKQLIAKIADFGLSRLLRDKCVYEPSEDAKLPLKWCAVECLSGARGHTQKSDIWSYGILIMELFTGAEMPYNNIPNWRDAVQSGYRMSQPKTMPDYLYSLLVGCWKEDPNKRPPFSLIYNTLVEVYWSIPRNSISFDQDKPIAKGNFGKVFIGNWNRKKIAVKEINMSSEIANKDFIKEVELMKQLQHQNIVLVYGSCSEDLPYLLVMEFMVNGSLLAYMKTSNLQFLERLNVCKQVANGMAYLEEKNVIHRDLAARNILVGDDLMVKIADFGLSRLLQEKCNYEVSGIAQLAARWLPVECCETGIFSIKSDVWSFGILVMEIFTNGKRPYNDLDQFKWKIHVKSGHRMKQPESMPDGIYNLVMQCWRKEEDDRPSFKTIYIDLYTKLFN